MIYGIGTDITEIKRIEKSSLSSRFLEFCFSVDELREFASAGSKLAGCFASKEALAKALGTGVRGFSLSEVSVLRDTLGKPYFRFSGNIKRIIEEKGLRAHLSITNTAELAQAFVVLEVES